MDDRGTVRPEARAPSRLARDSLRSMILGLALLTLVGLIAGVFLTLVTDFVDRAGISGPGWSLRGNGALIVPVLGFPITLGLAMTMLTLWLQANRLSCMLGVATAFVALLIAGFVAIGISPLLGLLILLAVLGVALVLSRYAGRWRETGWFMAGTLVMSIALYAGLLIGAIGILPVWHR
jgi:hypothetical protein